MYLAGLSLASLLATRTSALLVAAGVVAAGWGIAGVTVLPAPDASGTMGCAFLIAVLDLVAPTGLRRRLHGRRRSRALRHGDRDVDVGARRARASASPRATRRAASRAATSSSTSSRSTLVARLGVAAGALQSRRGRRSAGVDDGAGANQLARRVDLAPGVPEQEPARLAVAVDVGDDALAVRLGPLGDGVQTRVHVADRLVAELEQVGVEERQMVVRLRRRRPCSRRRRDRACSRDPRARRAAFRRAPRTGKRATSPAANTSSRPPARPSSSTRTPSSTSSPAASASSVAGTIPRPATIASASIVVPFFVVTEPAEIDSTSSSARTVTPFSR